MSSLRNMILPLSIGAAVTAGIFLAGGAVKDSVAQDVEQQEEVAKPTSLLNTAYSMENLPPLIKAITGPHSQAVRAMFETEVPGVQGWVFADNDDFMNPNIVYTFAGGEIAFSGTMFGLDSGSMLNFSSLHEAKFIPKPDLNKVIADIDEKQWVADGAQGDTVKSVIYGFFDPNCVYCHLSWLALKPYMDAGLQVRWLPVAVLGGDSLEKSTSIFNSDDPRKLMEESHAKWEESGRENAFPKAIPNVEAADQIDANSMLMQQLQIRGTPAFLFKDVEGNWKVGPGMPPLGEIPGITGMPEIPNDHPKLQRFR